VPTYQYACTVCGHQLEAVQSFADEPLTECPACEGRLRKVFNSVGIVFKGSGFYRTDSRAGNGAKGEPAKVDAKSESKSDSKSESKSESKTGGTSESKSDSSSSSSSSSAKSSSAPAAA
jgi:putative FmdB family regulatory protein